jgi:hypothetical protein
MKVNNEVTVFIGHGKSSVWRELKDFLVERLHLAVDEFNRISVAGIPTASRLDGMLDTAAFAFLIMTAEDEQTDGKLHARLNVVHEAGLFQGRLGFEKAIILLEEGCEEFSNIHGLGQIRFPKGSISAKFEEIRAVLEREWASLQRLERSIEVVDVDIPRQNNSLTFPLKCNVTLRNASVESADVRLIRHIGQTVTPKQFVSDVLQVKLREWCPAQHGVDRVSVLPDQLFRAWVGLDETKFSEGQVKGLLGRIGTLCFLVNGKTVSVDV